MHEYFQETHTYIDGPFDETLVHVIEYENAGLLKHKLDVSLQGALQQLSVSISRRATE